MYWVLYDISSDRRRNKLARLCLDFGLKRVQKSCFLGDMKKQQRSKFERQMEQILEPEDQVCLIPIPEKSVPEMKTWGKNIDLQAEFAPALVCFA